MDLAAEHVMLVAYLSAVLAAVGVAYRLYLHPLAMYPGPTMAALTDAYTMYYDIIREGQMVAQLQKLHKRYGPVVRYGPNKLHFSDPAAYDEIYRNPSFAKEEKFYNGFVLREASFGLTNIKEAKERRQILLPFFSRKNVLKLEHVVQQTIDRFIAVLSTKAASQLVVDVRHAYSCITLEVMTEYCFAKRLGAIEYPDFHHPVILAFESIASVSVLLGHLPFLVPLVFGLPNWLANSLVPSGRPLVEFREDQAEHIDAILRDPTTLDREEHEIIYHHLLNLKSGTPLRRKVLEEEAATLIGAGTETVGNACSVTTYYVLANTGIKKALVKELKEAWPDLGVPMPLEKLEKLPYLTACINEGLRISHGTVSPLPRVVKNPSVINGHPVPANTIVSSSQTCVHFNEDIYPNPTTYHPERWLKSDNGNMEANLVSFSKGQRMCIGINLARAELYLILGNLFRRVDLELIDTTEKDMEWKAYFLPVYNGKIRAIVNCVKD